MSKLALDTLQLGSSATASQNLVIKTNKDGTFTIARGNEGATTQDLLTIDAAGKIDLPQTRVPVFSAYANALLNAAHATWTKILFQVEEFDSHDIYNTSTSRCQPNLPGYYYFIASVEFENPSYCTASIGKNGSNETKRGAYVQGYNILAESVLYMNGTTDYVEVNGYQQSGATQHVIYNNGPYTFFQGFLIREA